MRVAARRLPTWPPHWLIPLAVWTVVTATLIGTHLPFYFQQPQYEISDFAANALQIRDSKAFREDLGNYSRWGFNHPGPAFLYAYGLGEILLYDWLRLLPAPFNAHLVTGVALQALFFTWAVMIIRRRVRRPVIAPLLLVLGAGYFGLVNYYLPDSAFQSIWPPYVLLFPFLCFIVAAASLASGEAKDVVPLVLSGGFLVHGHVAQPLFVVPLALLAYAALLTRLRGGAGWSSARGMRTAPVAHAIAAGMLLVFLLPIALDLLRGGESNISLIVKHLSEHSGDRKTLAQSLVYFATFLCHLSAPEQYCEPLTLSSLSFLKMRWWLVLSWAAIGIGTIFLLHHAARSGRLPEADFVRWLATFVGAGSVLTVVWGSLQAGQMFAFNSHFNFALLFAVLILMAIGLAALLPRRRLLGASVTLIALSVPLFVGVARNFSSTPAFEWVRQGSATLFAEVETAARADRQVGTTKFLQFDHAVWPQATAVALALQRAGFDFAVSADWSVMFGREHVREAREVLGHGTAALWRVRPPAGSQQGWIEHTRHALDPADASISFGGPAPNAGMFVVFGWDVTNDTYSWSTRKEALLHFATVSAMGDVEIQIDLFPSTVRQRIAVTFNEEHSASYEVTRRQVIQLRVPMEAWNRRRHATLTFDFPDAISPKDAGVSIDARPLGCGFVAIQFRSVPPASHPRL